MADLKIPSEAAETLLDALSNLAQPRSATRQMRDRAAYWYQKIGAIIADLPDPKGANQRAETDADNHETAMPCSPSGSVQIPSEQELIRLRKITLRPLTETELHGLIDSLRLLLAEHRAVHEYDAKIRDDNAHQHEYQSAYQKVVLAHAAVERALKP